MARALPLFAASRRRVVVEGRLLMDVSAKEHRAVEAVLARATVDFEFRQQLLTAPRQAIQEAYGFRIPPDFQIKFIERDRDVDALIVLPDMQPGHARLSAHPPRRAIDRVGKRTALRTQARERAARRAGRRGQTAGGAKRVARD
jgi:hypothetical protein